jgi:SNF2 family DNA or RNA helicase
MEHLVSLLPDYPDKVVIFTQFRDTQEHLGERLRAAGESVVLFHGSLSRLQKEEAIQQFRGPARILVSTDSGSEGRNLQFCNVIVNFDLPWNPMKIEQRIGRLSRIGQQRDVHVINLVAAETLEAAMLYLLDAKIAMFELVIGEVDMILGSLEEDQEFEEMVAELWVQTETEQDFRQAMETLGERLVSAKQRYLEQRAYEDTLFGERFAPDQ